ncbi:MAG: acetylornithine transaminase [Pseudomonadota bacterium]
MSNAIIDAADTTLATTYARHPIVLTRGSGCRLWDSEGREYIDFFAGIAVCSLGHANPRIARALARQAETLCHVSNLFYTEPQVRLAEWLTHRCFADRVFFCNSGAEANEAAIKLVRKFFHDQGQPERHRIIAMTQSFHGRTMGALSATGQDKIKKGIYPLLGGFSFVPFNDIPALKAAVDDTVCAVLLEPIQGEGGVVVPSAGYLKAVREICDAAGCLMVLDEVQTGMGRTGRLFAHEHAEIAPDVMTLAKALANGLPIGAMLATEKAAAAFVPGAHATTFGGTPVITAAALETARIIEEDGVLAHCVEMGAYLMAALNELKARHAVIRDVRGVGLLCGVALACTGAPVVKACLDRGILVNCVQDRVLRLAPPLIVDKAEIDALIACLDAVLSDAGVTAS